MHLITSEELAKFLEIARNNRILAIDTEFLSGKTYYSKLCLIQIASNNQTAYIDPLEAIDLSPLIEILSDDEVVKIIHSSGQDLVLLTRLCGTPPKNVFDTQIAATLAGYPSQVGYGQLVSDIAGVKLEKSESFTDWSRRPLTPKQIDYALDDVLYLQPIYEKLLDTLTKTGRILWLRDDFAALSDPATYENVPALLYKKVRQASKLTRRQLAILRELAVWREFEAQKRDLPRQWIAKDEVLLELARKKPPTLEALAETRDFNARALKDKGHSILASISTGLELPNEDLPLIERRKETDTDLEGIVKLMSALVRLRSEEHGVASSLLAAQSDLDSLASGEREDNPLMHGWRRELIGLDLIKLLDGKLSLRIVNGELVAEEVS